MKLRIVYHSGMLNLDGDNVSASLIPHMYKFPNGEQKHGIGVQADSEKHEKAASKLILSIYEIIETYEKEVKN